MNRPKLTNSDYCKAAIDLKCDVAALMAVAEVETKGQAFYADGFPVILFERHKFYKYVKERSAADAAEWFRIYPSICNPKSGGYGKAGQNQRDKFNFAFSLDKIAAMKACSWGKFQIMGFNHKLCGFKSVGEFVDAMKSGEAAQLRAFINFVKSCGLTDELRRLDWAGFARGYNGINYRANNYDGKMAFAYAKYKKLKLNCHQVILDEREIDNLLIRFDEQKPAVQIGELTEEPAEIPNNSPPIPQTQSQSAAAEIPDAQSVSSNNTQTIDAPPKENSVDAAAKLTIAGFVVPPFLMGLVSVVRDLISQGVVDTKQLAGIIINFISNNTHYLFWAILAIIGLLTVKKLCKQITLWIQMFTAARRDMNSVEVVPQK